MSSITDEARVESATNINNVIEIESINYLPWSCSRAEAACSCLYKFYNIYYLNHRETSRALTLGGLSHAILAQLLDNKITDLETAQFIAKVYILKEESPCPPDMVEEIEKMLPYFVKFVGSWNNFLVQKGITKDRIEHPYALTREAKRASFFDTTGIKSYIRGIVDLWAYDPVNQELYVIDHKTNKSISSSKKVKEHTQLKLYVAMLTHIYGLKVKKAHIALNFLRKGKLVWATITPTEAEDFLISFYKLLVYLEHQIFEAEMSLTWEPRGSYQCSYCSFRDTCPGRNGGAR